MKHSFGMVLAVLCVLAAGTLLVRTHSVRASGDAAEEAMATIRPEAIRAVDAWIERYRTFWSVSFDRLDSILNAPEDASERG